MILILKEFSFVEKYYIPGKGLKNKSTQRLYIRSINKFSDFVDEKGIKVFDFRAEAFNKLLDDFRLHLKKSYNYKPGTIRITVKIVLNYFEYLEATGRISNFRSIEITDDDEVKPENIISPEEYDKLETYLINENDYVHLFIFQIAYYCGLKNKYLRILKYTDFTIDKDGRLYYFNIITKDSPYKIYLPEKVKNTFLNINIQKNSIYILDNKGVPYYPRYLTRLFEKTCTAAGIKNYAPKDFRHSCILNYILDHGVNVDDICLRFNWGSNNIERLYKAILKSKGINVEKEREI